MAGKGVVRSIKNYAKGFSDVQIKVREATSNDSSGPSGSLMNEIAQLTYNEHDFVEVMDMLDRRLNDKGKNWRHVFKALLLLDYCIHVGSENVVLYAKENIYVVRTLKEFQHVDDSGKDVGHNIRQKAKEITSLLLDDQRLKEERRSRTQLQDRMAMVGDYVNDVLFRSKDYQQESDVYRNPGYLDEDRDLKKAIEASKILAEQESRQRGEGTDEDLQRAIRESEQEAREMERRRKEALDKENEKNLFEQQSQQAAQPTGMSFSEPIQQQYNPYRGYHGFQLQAQMTGFQTPQMTGFQTTHMPNFQAPQTTSYQTPQTTDFQAQPMTGYQMPLSTGYQAPPSTGYQTQQTTGYQMFQTTGYQVPQTMNFQTPQMTGYPTQTTTTADQTNPFRMSNQNRDNGMDIFGTTNHVRIL
ncbi:Epsin-1 [Choanephora cucurbitarum]|uniref:Epsin-1 n=1 Tax=Choanephora cucurbitarum TaxID=101091 RepID=A0A1C7NAH4_9FUNG|nr:Epsin-1 [Choanephora cucurbitarum]